MDEQKTAPRADGVVLSPRERQDAGWREYFKAVPIDAYVEAISPVGRVPGGFEVAPGDDGAWVLRAATGNLLVFSRWLVPA